MFGPSELRFPTYYVAYLEIGPISPAFAAAVSSLLWSLHFLQSCVMSTVGAYMITTHVPNREIVSGTCVVPQNEIANYLGL